MKPDRSARLRPLVACIALMLGACHATERLPFACAGNAIDDTQQVSAGDASLYLLVRGRRCDAPLLLWLHGGPGGAQTPLFRLYDAALEDGFLVAYWDQRGAGLSYDPEADPTQLSIERHLGDLDRVVDRLRARYGKRRLALVGHSWGSALGLLYAQRHPGKVAVVVGVNPLVSGLRAQQGQYAFARARAAERGDHEALERLRAIGEPPLAAADELRLQALVDRYGGYFHRRPSFTWAVIAGIASGYIAPWDIPSYIRANEVSLAAMQDELNALDLGRQLTSIAVPVVFMLGRYDRQLDAQQAADYVEGLSAPAKRLIWFEHSAHHIPFEEPERFVTALGAVLKAFDE